MSLVYITHHSENVRDYEVIEVSEVPAPPKIKYISQHKKFVQKQIQQPYMTSGPDGCKLITDWGKHERRTMGCARTPLDPPACFLRKNQGLKWRRLHDHVCLKPEKQQLLRTTTTASQTESVKSSKKKSSRASSQGRDDGQKSTDKSIRSDKGQPKTDRRINRKNFIAINRKRAVQSKVKRPPPKFVDSSNGDRQNVLNSGLVPQFVCGKNFARTPCYIKSHKKLLERYKETCTNNLIDGSPNYLNQTSLRKMSVEERVAILEGLKVNYVEVLKTFQTLSLCMDTPTKRLRKSRLEKELLQLEADIQFLEENPVIHITDF